MASGGNVPLRGGGASAGPRLLGCASPLGGCAAAPRGRGRGRAYGAWQSLEWAGH